MWGKRADKPRLIWRSVLPEKAPVVEDAAAAQHHLLRGIVEELMLIESNRRRPRTIAEAERGSRHEQEVKAAIIKVATDDSDDHDIKRWTDEVRALAEGMPGGAIGAPNNSRGMVDDAGGEHWRETADKLADEIKKEGKKVEAQEKQRAIGRWKTWLREDIDKGGRHAHQFSRVPQTWRPAVTTPQEWKDEGYVEDDLADDDEAAQHVVSAAPWKLLGEKRAELAAKWDAAEQPFHYDWEQWERAARARHRKADAVAELPRLTPEQLRSASNGFRARTASTYDGFHVRHFG